MEKLKEQLKLQQAIIDNLNKEIEKLESEKEHILRLAVENANANEYCLQELEKEVETLREKVKPFNDEYFKGLSYEYIAELAKKSLNITSENCEIRHLLEDIYIHYDLNERYIKRIKKYIIIED